MTKPEVMWRATRLALLLVAALGVPASSRGVSGRNVRRRCGYATPCRYPICVVAVECARRSGAGRRQASGSTSPCAGTRAERQSALGDPAGDAVEHPRTADILFVAPAAAATTPSRLCRLQNHRHRRRSRHGSSVRSFRWSAPLSPMTIRALGFLSIRQRMRGCA